MRNLLGAVCLLLGACAQTQTPDIAIRGATVVDVTDGSLHPGQTVLVAGHRIVAVGPEDAVRVPRGTEMLEAAGDYLIPGLWDAHVHSAGSVGWHFPLFIAYGITSVRNMHTNVDHPLEFVVSIKRRVGSGELLGPRFLANGGVVDGDPPVHQGSVVVRNAEEARAAVDRLVDGGADFIKVYDRLSREAYFAILERAKERGIPVDGHLPPLIRPEEAAAAGQRTIEHTSGITMGCASGADAVRADYERYLEQVPQMRPFPDQAVGFFSLVRRALDERDAELCRRTARVFNEQGVVSVPTLVESLNAKTFVADETRMALLPTSVRNKWKAMAEGPPGPGAEPPPRTRATDRSWSLAARSPAGGDAPAGARLRDGGLARHDRKGQAGRPRPARGQSSRPDLQHAAHSRRCRQRQAVSTGGSRRTAGQGCNHGRAGNGPVLKAA
jgi:hypothetical protein